jgi:hypothetical protein
MSKLRAVAAAGVIAFILALPGVASAACYSAAEFEAEQGLRIHSELMVIGLTCAKMPGGTALYGKYQSFTHKNQTLISSYENTLISHLRKSGSSNPEKDFHTLRTGLANHISQLAIGNVVGFCNAFTPRLDTALGMDQQKLRRWAQQVWRDAPTSRPLCTR